MEKRYDVGGEFVGRTRRLAWEKDVSAMSARKSIANARRSVDAAGQGKPDSMRRTTHQMPPHKPENPGDVADDGRRDAAAVLPFERIVRDVHLLQRNALAQLRRQRLELVILHRKRPQRRELAYPHR
jgi:hypothetical protein